MARKYTKWEDHMAEYLKKPAKAKEYLNLAIQEYQNDGDKAAFLLALEHIIRARGGFAKLSQKTKLSRTSLYKTLSSKGNPEFDTIGKIVGSLGYKLAVV